MPQASCSKRASSSLGWAHDDDVDPLGLGDADAAAPPAAAPAAAHSNGADAEPQWRRVCFAFTTDDGSEKQRYYTAGAAGAAGAADMAAQQPGGGEFVTVSQLLQERHVRAATATLTRAEIIDELMLAYMDACRAEMRRKGWRLSRHYYMPRDRCFIQCVGHKMKNFVQNVASLLAHGEAGALDPAVLMAVAQVRQTLSHTSPGKPSQLRMTTLT